MVKIRYWAWIPLLCLLAACQQERVEHSASFDKIFREGEGTFRGVDLGDDLEKVRKIENGLALNDDRFGLVYRTNLDEGEKCMVEYMSMGDEPRTVSAILVNAMLAREQEATRLYNEVEAYLRGRHGVPEGSFGTYAWLDPERSLDITLRMLSDKKSFSLNFARPF